MYIKELHDKHGGKFTSVNPSMKKRGFLDKLKGSFSGGDSGGGNKTAMMASAASMAKGLMGGGEESQTMDANEGAMGGAMSGAMAGASFGVPGAVIGGVAGAVQGAAAARAAAKAHNRQVEAKKHQALAEIEMKKGEQLSSAIQGMAGRMRIS